MANKDFCWIRVRSFLRRNWDADVMDLTLRMVCARNQIALDSLTRYSQGRAHCRGFSNFAKTNFHSELVD